MGFLVGISRLLRYCTGGILHVVSLVFFNGFFYYDFFPYDVRVFLVYVYRLILVVAEGVTRVTIFGGRDFRQDGFVFDDGHYFEFHFFLDYFKYHFFFHYAEYTLDNFLDFWNDLENHHDL